MEFRYPQPADDGLVISQMSEESRKSAQSDTYREGVVALRDMTPADIPLFRSWLVSPRVARWYHDPEAWIAEAEEMYGEYGWIHRFIAELDGRPIGFCQYYAARDSGEDWLSLVGTDGVYSLDYLIGEPDALRRGFGKQLLRRLTEQLAERGARRIAVQPEMENRASRALLRSCGFAEMNEGIFVMELP